jgi:transcriptional regulator with XRE-family HTH domain
MRITLTIRVRLGADGDWLVNPEAGVQKPLDSSWSREKTRKFPTMTPDELVSLRKRLDLTQQGLGELIGLGLRAYQDLEAGKSPIRPLHVLALERVAEKLAVVAKNPLMAPETVRRDALDLAALIQVEIAVTRETTMSRKLAVDRNLRQQLHQKLLEAVPAFDLYLRAQDERDEENRLLLLARLRQIPNFRLWEKLGRQITRTEEYIASGHGTSNWYAPKKEKRTSRELADMIMANINIGGVHVAVHPDPAYGWHPTVVTAPSQAVECQRRAEQIAKQLREKFDLRI